MPTLLVNNDEAPEDASMTIHRCLSADDANKKQIESQYSDAIISPRHRSLSEDVQASCTPRTNQMRSFVNSLFDSGSDNGNKNMGLDDDDVSTSSSRYFDKADFLEANWENAVDYIPPVGLAVVAGGLALLFHPFIIAAGALTALGTVHAAGATHDLCVDGALCNFFEQSPNETERQASHENRKDEEDRKDGNLPLTVGCVSTVTCHTMFDDDDDDDLKLNKTLASHFPDEEEEQKSDQTDPSLLRSQKDIMEWMNLFYPSLQIIALEKKEFFGLNALEFFEVFFANDAPYTFEEFQKKREDKDICYGRWENVEHVQQPSLLHGALSSSDLKLPNLQERVLKFKAKTNNGYFGPPYATTTKVQRALLASKRLLVLESKTTLADIPFCDRFHVIERWVVTAEKKADEQYHISLSIYAQVFFSKKCPFDTQIKTKTKETILEIAYQWSHMAQEALKLSEEARFKRILRKSQQHQQDEKQQQEPNHEHDEPDLNAIELQYSGSNEFSVVGEQKEQSPAEEEGGRRHGRVVRRNSSIGSRMSRSFSKYLRGRSLSSCAGDQKRIRSASTDMVAAIKS